MAVCLFCLGVLFCCGLVWFALVGAGRGVGCGFLSHVFTSGMFKIGFEVNDEIDLETLTVWWLVLYTVVFRWLSQASYLSACDIWSVLELGQGCTLLFKGVPATAPLVVRGWAQCRRITSTQSCQPISTDVVSRFHSVNALRRKTDRNS